MPTTTILLPSGEVDAPVTLIAFFGLVGALRPLLTIANGFQPVGRHTQAHQKVLGGRFAAVAETEILLGRTALVAIPLQNHLAVLEIVQNVFNCIGILRLRRKRILADIALVEVEES